MKIGLVSCKVACATTPHAAHKCKGLVMTKIKQDLQGQTLLHCGRKVGLESAGRHQGIVWPAAVQCAGHIEVANCMQRGMEPAGSLLVCTWQKADITALPCSCLVWISSSNGPYHVELHAWLLVLLDTRTVVRHSQHQ